MVVEWPVAQLEPPVVVELPVAQQPLVPGSRRLWWGCRLLSSRLFLWSRRLWWGCRLLERCSGAAGCGGVAGCSAAACSCGAAGCGGVVGCSAGAAGCRGVAGCSGGSRRLSWGYRLLNGAACCRGVTGCSAGAACCRGVAGCSAAVCSWAAACCSELGPAIRSAVSGTPQPPESTAIAATKHHTSNFFIANPLSAIPKCCSLEQRSHQSTTCGFCRRNSIIHCSRDSRRGRRVLYTPTVQ